MTDSTPFDNAKLTIRKAYPQDAPALAAMLVALCEFEGTQTPFDALKYAKTIQRLIESDNSNYFFLIAESDDVPLGFISYYFGYDLSSLSQGAHVGDLFIRDEWRNAKIGSKLMAAVAKQVMHQSGQWISLTALKTNSHAKDFYEKRGGIAVPVQFYAWGQKGLEKLIKAAS